MIKKNFKKDFLNCQEELAFSKLEEPLKSRSDKLRIESKMRFVLPRPPLKKESSSVEVAPCYTQAES